GNPPVRRSTVIVQATVSREASSMSGTQARKWRNCVYLMPTARPASSALAYKTIQALRSSGIKRLSSSKAAGTAGSMAAGVEDRGASADTSWGWEAEWDMAVSSGWRHEAEQRHDIRT